MILTVRHDIALKAKFFLKKTIESLAILTSIRAVESVVRALFVCQHSPWH
jgi:hypothetical protein